MLTAVAFVIIIVTVIIAVIIGIYGRHYFKLSTQINGVDCSFLTIDSARKKLEKSVNSTEIKLKFADGKEYTCLGAYFDIELTNKNALKDALNSQNSDTETGQNITLNNLYSVNEEKVKKYLSSLSVFNTENMKAPQNAYLKYNSKGYMEIQPEVYGNEINLDTACNYMIDALKRGETVIDFTTIMNITPKILESDSKLKEEQESINTALKTKVEYKLKSGETYTLNADIIKDWVVQDKDGYYSLDLDNNIPKFVEKLKEKAEYLLTSTEFNATGIGKIKVPFGRKTYATINTDEEIKRLKEQIVTGKSYNVEPIYNALPNYKDINTYVEVDLSRQRVWLYVNGKCILNTACVTGNVSKGYGTPSGIYYLTYKTTDTYLEGYNSDGSKYKSPVKYWMPFNGGIGFHDATWRGSFGGNIYMTNGSHGCVNLPISSAKTLYQNINSSMPIILYNS